MCPENIIVTETKYLRDTFLHIWSTVLENDSILIDTDHMIFTPVFYHYQICSIFMKLLHYILFYVAMTHRSVL